MCVNRITLLKGSKIKWYIVKLWSTSFTLPSHRPHWQGLLWAEAQANGATSSRGSPYLSHTPAGQ